MRNVFSYFEQFSVVTIIWTYQKFYYEIISYYKTLRDNYFKTTSERKMNYFEYYWGIELVSPESAAPCTFL